MFKISHQTIRKFMMGRLLPSSPPPFTWASHPSHTAAEMCAHLPRFCQFFWWIITLYDIRQGIRRKNLMLVIETASYPGVTRTTTDIGLMCKTVWSRRHVPSWSLPRCPTKGLNQRRIKQRTVVAVTNGVVLSWPVVSPYFTFLAVVYHVRVHVKTGHSTHTAHFVARID